MQPGAEPGSALETVDVPRDLQERVLAGLLSVLPARQEPRSMSEYIGLDQAQ
jgi:hypothetical protein